MALDLDKIDLVRYSRQLPLLGAWGQVKLLESKVAVVGLGGLGSIIAMYLAALGVGKLIIVDYDVVGVDNLNRQILYNTGDVGKPKALVAMERLKSLNPLVEIEAYNTKVTRDNVDSILRDADIIVDGLDDWYTRLVLDEYAWEKNKPYVHAAVDGYYGQVTVILSGKTTCLACITPKPIPEPGCRVIVAPTVGIVASIEVMEVLKLITGIGEPLTNKLIIVNALKPSIEEVVVKPSLDCSTCRKQLLG
ncbi:MAG: HesA/MoeB/ThiF family protein [Acidilobaceae archaeon]